MGRVDTKDIILTNAISLFSEKGFAGASVRDIAAASQVNLAAINYHFTNKETLFKESLVQCYKRLSRQMKVILNDNSHLSIEDLAIKMFGYFIEQSQMFKASFRIFLLDTDLFPDNFGTDDDEIGPPGGNLLYKFIQNKHPEAKEDDLLWSVRVIFSLIMHKSLIFTSNCAKANTKLLKFSRDDFESDIRRTVKLIVSDI